MNTANTINIDVIDAQQLTASLVKSPVIATPSMKLIDLFNLDRESISICDIALGLSRQYLFNGLSDRLVTIAAHSVWVSQYVLLESNSKDVALRALLHRAPEAYIGHVHHALRKQTAFRAAYDELHIDLMMTMNDAIELPVVSVAQEELIKHAEKMAVAMSAKYLWSRGSELSLPEPDDISLAMSSPSDMPPKKAERVFLETYKTLIS